MIYIQLYKFNEAEADLDKALKLDSNWYIALFAKGLLYEKKEEYDKAINFYQKSLKNNPKNYMAYNNIGHIYFRNKKYELAIDNYTSAIEVYPKYFNAYRNRADAKNANGDIVGACQDLRKASELGDAKSTKFFNEICK